MACRRGDTCSVESENRFKGNPMTVDQLTQELLGNEPSRRREAADRLATLGPEATPATAALVEACADPALRDLCVGALEELESPPLDALPRLAELLGSPDDTVAYWAATLLGRAGQDASAHASALERLAADANRPGYVRDRAANSRRKTG